MSFLPDPGKTSEVFVVAMGGSAGSLSAIIDFFDHTPLDNAAYVVLRHMPREERSHLGLILQKHSMLDIVEVMEDQKVEKNKIYYPTAGKHLVLEGETLVQVERESTGSNRGIDLFFNSLARSGLGFRAIGVIMSGAGTDGVKGMASIKSAGGLVIAQTPAQTEYPSMSLGAIQAGDVHRVALAAEIPALIREYVDAHLKQNV